MVSRLNFWVAALLLFPAYSGHAQVVWNKIMVPDGISAFSIGSDGALYVRGALPARHLYFSSDRGAQWKKIYSRAVHDLACDSNGAVIIGGDSGRYYYSLDHGSQWNDLAKFDVSGSGGIACTREAIYCAPGYDNILYRKANYIARWDSLFIAAGVIDDLRAPTCGSGDRVVVGLSFESSWVQLDRLSKRNDTLCRPLIFTDNSPPKRMLFGGDGYLYMDHFGYTRRPTESRRWDCYDSYDTSWHSRSHHFPSASLAPDLLVSADIDGTWTSKDHASSWDRKGNAPAGSWIQGVSFDASNHGYAFTDSGLFRTENFAGVKYKLVEYASLILAPNPAGAYIFAVAKNVRHCQVMDALGRTVIDNHFSIPAEDPKIAIEALPPGMYYLLVESNRFSKIASFVKE